MPIEITASLLKRMAGKTTYGRGKDYYQEAIDHLISVCSQSWRK